MFKNMSTTSESKILMIPTLLPDSLWDIIKNFQLDYKKKHKQKLTKVLNQFTKGCYDRRRPPKMYKKGYKKGYHPEYLEYLMSSWVDSLYSEPWGWLSQKVHIDGRYIKPVNYFEHLPVRPGLDMLTYFDMGRINHQEGREDKITRGEDSWKREVYSFTYYSNARDWRTRDPRGSCSDTSKVSIHYIPDGTRRFRLERGLPLYEDKARYTMKLDSGRCRPPIVKLILKNIKKWEKYNPKLCDYNY